MRSVTRYIYVCSYTALTNWFIELSNTEELFSLTDVNGIFYTI